VPRSRLLRALLAGTVLLPAGIVLGAQPPAPARPDGQILRDQEARFARVVAAKEVKAFTAVWAEDAVIFPPGGGLVSGPAKITEEWSPLLTNPDASLTWAPIKAEIAASGDLGYTYGRYESKGKSADGKPVVRTGHYVSIWRKGPDGAWKVILDIGSPDPPPAPAEAKPTP
jgi:ketosteroid isomerase-like protein